MIKIKLQKVMNNFVAWVSTPHQHFPDNTLQAAYSSSHFTEARKWKKIIPAKWLSRKTPLFRSGCFPFVWRSEIPFVEFLSLFFLVKVMVSSESNSENKLRVQNYIVQIKINIFKGPGKQGSTGVKWTILVNSPCLFT